MSTITKTGFMVLSQGDSHNLSIAKQKYNAIEIHWKGSKWQLGKCCQHPTWNQRSE